MGGRDPGKRKTHRKSKRKKEGVIGRPLIGPPTKKGTKGEKKIGKRSLLSENAMARASEKKALTMPA